MKILARDDARRPPMQGGALDEAVSALYNLDADPYQENPINDSAVANKMIYSMTALMRTNDAPAELYGRFGLQE
ncbi:MAG: hypothetical protein WA888_24305 [Burkholderiaceae bacterium]